MGKRWEGIQKIHKSSHVRGVVGGGVDIKMEEEQNLEGLSGQALIDKNKTVSKEINRLKKLFKDLDENKKKLSKNLIENAAFMSITLEDLKKDIIKYGVKETYVNGKDQFGFKESVESKTYNTMIKNYMNIIKQLNDMLPQEKKIDEKDEFDKFCDDI